MWQEFEPPIMVNKSDWELFSWSLRLYSNVSDLENVFSSDVKTVSLLQEFGVPEFASEIVLSQSRFQSSQFGKTRKQNGFICRFKDGNKIFHNNCLQSRYIWDW
jgi:hypothetical protein